MDAWEFDDFEDVTFLVYVLFYNELEKKYGNSENFSSEYPNIFSDINSDTSKGGIFNKILQAISNKEIESNYTGAEDIFHIQIAALPFYDWVKKEGYELSYMAEQSIKLTSRMHALKDRVDAFKQDKLEVDDLKRLIKEPLWELNAAILYISGYKSYGHMEVDEACVNSDENLAKARKYAKDSERIAELRLHGRSIPQHECYAHFHYQEQVKPREFLNWAKNSPIEFSLLEHVFDDKTPVKKIEKPAYITPDMQLMFDAVEHFWKDYDLKNPDRSKAPYKKDVVAWLLTTAKQRNISGFSPTRAKLMDTIMRCPEARMGGNV